MSNMSIEPSYVLTRLMHYRKRSDVIAQPAERVDTPEITLSQESPWNSWDEFGSASRWQ